MPWAAQPSATIRQAWPATSTSGVGRVGGELRGALGHQRARLPDVDPVALAHVHHDLPAAPGRVGDLTGVGHRHRLAAVAVTHAEVRRAAALLVAGDDLPGELVGLSGGQLARKQLAGRARLRGGGEARVGEGAGQQQRRAERDDEPDPALAGGVHPSIMARRAGGQAPPRPSRNLHGPSRNLLTRSPLTPATPCTSPGPSRVPSAGPGAGPWPQRRWSPPPASATSGPTARRTGRSTPATAATCSPRR